QERDDRRAGVDYQLPGVAESKQRTGDDPAEDDDHGQDEAEWMPRGMCRPLREVGEWRCAVWVMHANPLHFSDRDLCRGTAVRARAGRDRRSATLASMRRLGSALW